MDLTQLANLGEAIGGLAVVGSLLYLGHEVRMGTRTLRASKAAQSSESWSSFNEAMAQDHDIIDLVNKVHVQHCPPESLSREELIRLSFYCRSIMQRAEAEYFLNKADIHPASVYNNRVANIRSWMQLPAWQHWWEREKLTSMFSQDFVDSVFPPDKLSRAANR